LASAAIITVLTLFAPLICLALVILLVLGLLRAVMHFRKLVKDRLLKPT
jgi:flagellar biosynthesis protein FliQ